MWQSWFYSMSTHCNNTEAGRNNSLVPRLRNECCLKQGTWPRWWKRDKVYWSSFTFFFVPSIQSFKNLAWNNYHVRLHFIFYRNVPVVERSNWGPSISNLLTVSPLRASAFQTTSGRWSYRSLRSVHVNPAIRKQTGMRHLKTLNTFGNYSKQLLS